MKKFIVLTTALLLIGGSATMHSTMNAASVKFSGNKLLITDQDCISYLSNLGYRNVTVLQVYANGNRLCDTSFSYNTIVYVQNNTTIVGHEDAPNTQP